MPDDLRTRIAKVLHQRGTARGDDVEAGWTWTWEQESEEEQRSWLEDADALIAALGWREESCVQYTYAPRFDERGLDACDDCGEPVIHDQESAAALIEKLNSRRHGFKPELVTRYVTDWETTDE